MNENFFLKLDNITINIIEKLNLKMDINNSLIASDFNNDYLLSHLKINKKLKNKHKFYSKYFENFLLDYRELKELEIMIIFSLLPS